MGYFLARRGVRQNIILAILLISHHWVSLSARRCRAPEITRPSSGVTGIRSDNHVESWQCQQEMIWRNLGENFFPRFITEVRCSNLTCIGGQGSCRPVNINMKVLKEKSDSDCPDNQLPKILRSRWALQDISVPAYCECSSV